MWPLFFRPFQIKMSTLLTLCPFLTSAVLSFIVSIIVCISSSFSTLSIVSKLQNNKLWKPTRRLLAVGTEKGTWHIINYWARVCISALFMWYLQEKKVRCCTRKWLLTWHAKQDVHCVMIDDACISHKNFIYTEYIFDGLPVPDLRACKRKLRVCFQ